MAIDSGITRFIKLALNQQSVQDVANQAAAAGGQAAQTVTSRISRAAGTGISTEAMKQVLQLRRTFEQQLSQLKVRVTDKGEMQRQARAMGLEYKREFDKIVSGSGATATAGKRLYEAMRPRKSELETAQSANISKQMEQALQGAGMMEASFLQRMRLLGGRGVTTLANSINAARGVAQSAWHNVVSVAANQATTSAGPSLRQKLRAMWHVATDGLVDAVKSRMPNLATLDIPAVGNVSRHDRTRAADRFGTNSAKFRAEMQRLATEHRLANAQLTPFGRLLERLGFNARALSREYVALASSTQAATRVKRGFFSVVQTGRGQMQGLTNQLKTMVQGFAGLYAVRLATGYIRDAVHQAADMDAAWARMKQALADLGIQFTDVYGEIDRKVVQLGPKLGKSSAEMIETFATLLVLTGDYQKAINGVVTVYDLMVARQGTVEENSRRVGRAMMGDIGILGRAGVVIPQGKDPMLHMQQHFGGEALARANSWAGQLEKVAAAATETKRAIGEAFLTGANGATTMVQFWQNIYTWVKQNEDGIRTFGREAATVFKGLTTLLMGVAAVLADIRAIGRGARDTVMGLANLGALGVKGLEVITRGGAAGSPMDRVNTALRRRVEQDDITFGQYWADRDRDRAQRDSLRARAGQFTPTGAAPRPGLLTPATMPKEGMKAEPVVAREEMKTRQEILRERRFLMSGNEIYAQQAMERLTERRAELQEKINNLAGEEGRLRTQNAGEIRIFEGLIVQLDKAVSDYHKKETNQALARRAFSEENKRIEILRHAAMSQNDRASQEAIRQLTAFKAQLIQRQQGLNVASQRHMEIEGQILRINEALNEVVEARTSAERKVVEDLRERVELQVGEQAAIVELNRLLAMYTAQRIAAEAKGDQAAALRAARLQMSVRDALVTDVGARDERLGEIRADIKDPEQQADFKRELQQMDRAISREMQTQRALGIDISRLEAQRLQVRTLLREVEVESTTEIRKQITAAAELAKHGSTRTKALEEYREILARLKDMLGRSDLASDIAAQIEAMIVRVQAGIRALEEPSNALLNNLRQAWAEQWPDMMESALDRISDQWAHAFTMMFRDARNVNQALVSIPRGMAAAFLDEAKKMASGEAKKHLAWAVGQTAHGIAALAHGNFPKAGGHFKSAATHIASAAAWGAVAGAVGSLGMSANRAYDESADFGKDPESQTRDGLMRSGPIIYISVDGIDPTNIRHQDLVGEVYSRWADTTGGRVIFASNSGNK